MKEIHERITKIDTENHRDQTNESHVWLVDQLRKALEINKLLTKSLEACRPYGWRSYVGEEECKAILNDIEEVVNVTLEHVEYLNKDNKGKNV